MDIAHIEAAAQALDAVSFILTIPELVRKETLQPAQQKLLDRALKVMFAVFGEDNPLFAVLLFLVSTFAFLLGYALHRVFDAIEPGLPFGYLLMTVSGVSAGFNLIVIYIYMLGQLKYRRVFLVVGVTLFLGTKAAVCYAHLAFN